MKRIIIGLSFLLLSASPSLSQNSSKAYHTLADSLYRHHHYLFAADYYEKALKKSPNTGIVMVQLAKCYNRINRLEESEKWFNRASSIRTPFSNEDYVEYARVLISLKKSKVADSILNRILQEDPNNNLVRNVLDDLRNFEKYYRDSASVNVTSVSVNTADSEFAPVYYKNGLVFSAAKQEGSFRKKYHWDNSHYLNLYFTQRNDSAEFKNPQLFEEDLNTKHHDGPIVFYSKYQKMIVNRNQSLKVENREDVYEWRPGLFDGEFNDAKSTWEISPLPFNDPAHSYAHPSISEDGNVLYFVSDRPGGYGGTDIYRVARVNATWGTPFNLGPAINSVGNETFPFFIENTLYFSSEGHGGLGGFDIFVSTQTINGFTPPVNLGYPINSTDDDFSLVTESRQQQGYFSSSRTGNDDLFSFQRVAPEITIFAHIFDGDTTVPLADANIEVITATGMDITLRADSLGDFSFKLPEASAYLVIGSKNNKVGMVSDVAQQREEVKQIPAYGDTITLACIGTVKNELGLPKVASTIQITDQSTGKTLDHRGNQSLIIFQGEKGHNYFIVAKDDQGREASHQLNISAGESGIKRWSMIIPDTLPTLKMAARIFRADSNLPLSNANVKIITFGENDQEITADSEGIVNFTLLNGTAYVVIGSKDDFTGMHSGSAEKGMDKASITHPVPAYGDQSNNVVAIGLVTNMAGELLERHSASISNKSTGESMPIEVKKGLVTFTGKKGETYNISVSHDLYKTSLQTLHIPSNAAKVEKFSVVLESEMEQKRIDSVIRNFDYNTISARVPANSNLVFVDSEDGASRAYILSADSLTEISEEKGKLYLSHGNRKENLGDGTLSKLRTDPSSVFNVQVSAINLRSIYFDFDKSNLDAEDTIQLLLVNKILAQDQSLQLKVTGHADDRGQVTYNLMLSERRTKSVKTYLLAKGIEDNRIIEKGFGESQPAVSCNRTDCSEVEHQQNRRAEFVITKNAVKDFVKTQSSPASHADHITNSTKYEELLKDFSYAKVDGVLFKVSVGAYKKQPNLTFSELSDLGKIESVMYRGITYYYLSAFSTLKEAEQNRKEVIRRGIKGASISVYQNGEKITLKRYTDQLTSPTP